MAHHPDDNPSDSPELAPWLRTIFSSIFGILMALLIIGLALLPFLWLAGLFGGAGVEVSATPGATAVQHGTGTAQALAAQNSAEATGAANQIATTQANTAGTSLAQTAEALTLAQTATTQANISETSTAQTADVISASDQTATAQANAAGNSTAQTATTQANAAGTSVAQTSEAIAAAQTATAQVNGAGTSAAQTAEAIVAAQTATAQANAAATGVETAEALAAQTATAQANITATSVAQTAEAIIVALTATAQTVVPTATATPTTPPIPTATPTAEPLPIVVGAVPPDATPIPPPNGTITLVSPLSLDLPSYGPTQFVWGWVGDLIPPTYSFEVRAWWPGSPPLGVHDSVLDARTGQIERLGPNRFRLNISNIRFAEPIKGQSGIYFWTVLLVRVAPEYTDFAIQSAEPGRFRYESGGSGK